MFCPCNCNRPKFIPLTDFNVIYKYLQLFENTLLYDIHIVGKLLKIGEMNDFEFYKYIYDRELNRRSKLDESINIIIGVISLLVGFVSYFFSNDFFFKHIECNITLWILFSITVLFIALSILFLVKSYNNYLRGFNYPNIANLKKIREYQKITIPGYNQKVDKENIITFEDELINRLIRIADENTEINDKRAYDLYLSKTLIISTLIILFIISIILIIKNTQLC